MKFEDIKGMVFTSVYRDFDSITFETKDGDKYSLHHDQDCCETVSIDDLNGDLKDLENSPILIAEEATSRDLPSKDNWDESYTWTFYRIFTVRGGVVIRWYGTSNGYYSESVNFKKIS
jgi:hypothetical protein